MYGDWLSGYVVGRITNTHLDRKMRDIPLFDEKYENLDLGKVYIEYCKDNPRHIFEDVIQHVWREYVVAD